MIQSPFSAAAKTAIPATIPPAQIEQLLWVGRSLNLQSATDQALTKMFTGTNWLPTRVLGVRKTGGATVACAGGLYTAATKGGTAYVAAAQSWLACTGTLGTTIAAVAALTAAFSDAVSFFSLTTGSTGACTADVFVYGVVLD